MEVTEKQGLGNVLYTIVSLRMILFQYLVSTTFASEAQAANPLATPWLSS